MFWTVVLCVLAGGGGHCDGAAKRNDRANKYARETTGKNAHRERASKNFKKIGNRNRRIHAQHPSNHKMQRSVFSGNHIFGNFPHANFDDTVLCFDGVWWGRRFLALLRDDGGGDGSGVFHSDARQFRRGGGNIFPGFLRFVNWIYILGDASVEIFLVLCVYFDRTCDILDNALRKETTRKTRIIKC